MDTISKTWNQLGSLLGTLSPSQRLSLLVAPTLLLVAFGWMLWSRSPATSMTPLVGGKSLTPGEIETAVAVLNDRGLTDYSRDGNQLLVPAADVSEYHGALLAGGGLPNGWGEMFEQELTGSSVFTSNERLQTMREIALAKFIREWLRTMPEVMDGNVVWARSQKRSRFSQKGPSVTATVTIRPRPGREITSSLANSIRQMIANAIPDLTPNQVVVFTSNGKAFSSEDEENELGSGLVRRIREFTDEYRGRVEAALSYIPDVLVTVHVDLDNVASAVEEELKVNPKETAPVFQRTDDNSRTIARVEPRAEPGARSNTPRSLENGNGPRRDERSQDSREEIVQVASQRRIHRELYAAMPTGVRVSVGIPEDYYEQAVVQKGVERGEDDAGKQAFDQAVSDFRKTVEANVATSVSSTIGAPAERVSVTSYVRVQNTPEPLSLPWTTHLTDWFRRWGGTVGLGVFALMALWMVRRSGPPAADDTEDEADEEDQPNAPDPMEILEAAEPDPEQMAREELQTAVRDNPEMAAAVIGKWIRAGK